MAAVVDRLRQFLADSYFFLMWRQKIIQASFIFSSIIVSDVVYWLLASTSLDCDYVYFFQTVLLPTLIVSELFWQFLSARLTDASPRHAKTILLVTSCVQIALDAAAFFLGHVSKWFVFVWFVLRFAAQQQIGNSAGKIAKMRIEWVMEVPQEKQLGYFNAIVIMGELLGRSSAMLFVYVIGWQMGLHGWGFQSVRTLFFMMLALWDLVCVVCTVTLPVNYFLPLEKLQEVDLPAPVDDDYLLLMDENAEEEEGAEVNKELIGQDELQKAYEKEKELGEPAPHANALVAFKDYLIGSAKRFWDNGPLFFTSAHLWTIFMLISCVNVVLKFKVSDVSEGSDSPTRDNLCNGQLTNLLLVGTFNNVSIFIGVLIYNFVLTRIKPHLFYNKVFGGFAAIFAILFISIIWQGYLGSFSGAIILALLHIALYLVQTYDVNVSTAWAEPTIIAFVFSLQSSMAQLLVVIPIVFAALRVPGGIVIIFCIIVSTVLAAGSWIYSQRNRQRILLLSEPEAILHDEAPSTGPVSQLFDDHSSENVDAVPMQTLSPEDLADESL